MTSNIIGNYKLIGFAGSGGCGEVYVAENINKDGKAYIIKCLRGNYHTPKNISHLQKEIDNLIKLNENPKSEYIPFLYDSDKNNFIKTPLDKKLEENNNIINNEIMNKKLKLLNLKKARPYYVIDYFSGGNLVDYITTLNGFQEKYARLIFKKILEGIKFIHSRGLCHLDIKPENIVLTKEFKPIIIDYGLAEKYTDENGNIKPLKIMKGTKMYICPEMYINKPYSGIKADIFSLGVFLFYLVTNQYPFKKNSMINDELYSKIHQNNEISIQEYWNKIQPLLNVELSDNFKKLYLQMVAFDPGERPQNIDEILNSDWMKEIGDIATLEEELKRKFEEIFEKLKSTNKEYRLVKQIEDEKLTTRSVTVENEKSGKTPKKIPNDRININHYIIINGDLEVNKFMNSLIEDIKSEFDITQISIRDVEEYEYLKLELSFYDSEENSEDKFVSNEEEEEEEIDNDIKCKMEIELFQYDDGRYLLEFLRKKGGIHQYNKNFFEIRKIIEEKTLEPYIA